MGNRRQWLARALSDDAVEEVAKELGFEVCATAVEGVALRAWGLSEEMLEGVGTLRVLAAPEGFRLLHLRGSGPWEEVRRAMMAAHRAASHTPLLWWWSSPEGWTAAMVEEDERGKWRVKKLVLEREYPDDVGLMQWLSLGPKRRVNDEAMVGAEVWRRHISEVLDQDGVTRQFFRRFSEGLDELVEAMEGGPEDDEQRHELALGTLLRVVFLYFLQARGALDGDRRFVMRNFRDSSRKNSFYRGVLRPLFFGALNCPPDRREEAALRLGELPFLNGGLFEPTAIEREHPDLDWDDEVWRRLLEELFERHRFAVEWSVSGDMCRAVDPEMLGKVFEGLMYGDRRRQSGSFYTPREVVRKMVEEALSAWLCDEAKLERKTVEALFEGRAEALAAEERLRAREALSRVTVLDPAVGTGAFLIEVLRLLRRIDRGLDRAEGVIRTPGESYDRMRRMVHDHLCGVDIQPTAVRLCELRIWLAMLAALPELPADQMPPLPNLSHRLCTGNALVEPLDWVRFRVAGESASFGRRGAAFEGEKVERMATLQRAYTRSHGEEKRALRREIEQLQGQVERGLMASRRAVLRERLKPLRALERSEDLFGASGQLKEAQRVEKERLEAELEALERAVEDHGEERRNAAGFSFDARFAPVMANGGFDMVVTNPPWVREGRMDRATRQLYRARFEGSDHRLWPGAKQIGVRATFGAQVDMAGLFVERSLELLRPGGRLCALVPAKLFRSLHGSALRGILAQHSVEFLEDRSEDDESMFDATTYPAILGVKKESMAPAKRRKVDVSVWRRQRTVRFRAPLSSLCVHGGDVREPWMLVEPRVEAIFRKMQAHSVCLGAVEEMPIRRGVMTGRNGVFVMSPEEASQRFGEEVCQRYLRWAVRGRDVGGERPKQKVQILWPVDEDGEVARELPRELAQYFEAHRESLERRSDYRSGPIWTVFRRHEDIECPGIVWRDLGEELEASLLDGPSIPLNTAYYLPTTSPEAAKAVRTLFHSDPMRAMASAVAERARGGWRRHFAWVMRMLPVPRAWLKAWRAGRWSEVTEEAAIWRDYGLEAREVEELRCWRGGERAKDHTYDIERTISM